MFRKLTENDRQIALSYLVREPSYNVFTIGDIENFGFSCEFQDVWAEFNNKHEISAIMLRYYNNHIVYSSDEKFNLPNLFKVLKDTSGDWMLSGKESMVTHLACELGLNGIRHQTLAELNSENNLPEIPFHFEVEWAIPSDFNEVIALQQSIEEFGRLGGSTEAIRYNMESGTGRTAIIRRDSKIVSSASSAAENSRSTMIIGVCTVKSHRRNGFASACMTHLCRTLLKEQKVLCLFYENPVAARIYKKLGFRDVGHWAMVEHMAE